MEAFLVSTGLVAVAEIGDKTQLLALLLAARFRKPAPIILGILVATIANHALAAWVGVAAASLLNGPWMKWVLGLAFIGFGIAFWDFQQQTELKGAVAIEDGGEEDGI